MKHTDKKIIDEVKSWNFDFICINPNAGYSGSSRLIKIQHLISKEIVVCRYDIARKNQVRFYKYYTEQLNLKAKNELNKLKFGWVCLESYIKNNERMVKLQHSISREIITCKYKNAKKNNIYFTEYENTNFKDELNKLKFGWICLESYIKNRRRVKLQHSISKEIIDCIYDNAKKNNIYFTEYENMKIKNELNKLKYGWICLDTWIIKTKLYSKRIVKLQHSISKEIITCDYSNAKRNTVGFPKYGDIERVDNLNKLGKKVNPQYVCVCSNYRYSEKSGLFVSIKRKDGLGKIKIVLYQSLTKGCNPFNETQNRVEINEVHPLYKRMFKKIGARFAPMKLGKGSIIDFRVSHPNSKKINVVETKQSEIFHTYSKKQKARYTKLANLKQHNINKIYFSDPKGSHKKHGFISIKGLEKQLKKDFNLK